MTTAAQIPPATVTRMTPQELAAWHVQQARARGGECTWEVVAAATMVPHLTGIPGVQVIEHLCRWDDLVLVLGRPKSRMVDGWVVDVGRMVVDLFYLPPEPLPLRQAEVYSRLRRNGWAVPEAYDVARWCG